MHWRVSLGSAAAVAPIAAYKKADSWSVAKYAAGRVVVTRKDRVRS